MDCINYFFSIIILSLLFKYRTAICIGDYSDGCLICSNDLFECVDCDYGYYLSSGQCHSCGAGCNNCDNSGNCVSCKSGYYLSESSCNSCNSNCYSCTGSSLRCTSCRSGQYLSSYNCYQCNSPCTTCSSETSCNLLSM